MGHPERRGTYHQHDNEEDGPAIDVALGFADLGVISHCIAFYLSCGRSQTIRAAGTAVIDLAKSKVEPCPYHK
jgi:hypothetical protein